MLHAVIMAGGAGTRFWPASRELRPKQLLALTGSRAMLQETVDRLGGLVPAERVWVVTNQRLTSPVAAQLPELPPSQIIGEPCKRDTAPCVGLAADCLLRNDPEATMVVLPSDHVIPDAAAFRAALAEAAALVERRPERIVTFGVPPTYPAEIFGYIERGADLPPDEPGETSPAGDKHRRFEVVRFREKPQAAAAREFLASGRFYWNAGIFVWKAALIREALRRHEPEMAAHLATIAAAAGQRDHAEVFAREFAAIRPKSIDYAVLERHPHTVVIEAPFAWDDLGNWPAVARLRGHDADGNTILAKHLGINTRGTLVRGENGHLIVTVGLEDCIVVQTPDATLVAHKKDEEALRQIVKQLAEKGWTEHL